MSGKWIGALFIIAGCGGCGFHVAASGARETRLLKELAKAIRYMECELQYKMSTLPELCRQTGTVTSGAVKEVFLNLARELEWQLQPDAGSCMADAIEKSHTLPKKIRMLFKRLGTTLGRYALSGQLKELEHLRISCENELQASMQDQKIRLRSYRTLGLCTGAALAILLL